jgi:hypothetical protein
MNHFILYRGINKLIYFISDKGIWMHSNDIPGYKPSSYKWRISSSVEEPNFIEYMVVYTNVFDEKDDV